MAADDFFGRWAKRREEEKQQEEQAETARRAAAASLPAEPLPPPTLDDVDKLTAESDFSRFVGRDVDEKVQQSAMKKLFADPHFNVMDGLDVYIDDYGKPDPIPPEMLAALLHAKDLLDPLKRLEQPWMRMLDAEPQAQLDAEAPATGVAVNADEAGDADSQTSIQADVQEEAPAVAENSETTPAQRDEPQPPDQANEERDPQPAAARNDHTGSRDEHHIQGL